MNIINLNNRHKVMGRVFDSGFYKELFENASDMILLIDENEKKIIECNNTLCLNLGYTKDEILKLGNIINLFHPCNQRQCYKLNDANISNERAILVSKSHKKIYVNMDSSVHKNINHIIYRKITFKDIKDIITIEKKTEEEKNEYLKKNNDLNTLICILAHDFKSPLRAINNLSKIIHQDKDTALSLTAKEYLQLMINRSEQTYKIIDNIISFYKIDNRSRVKEFIDVRNFIEDIILSVDSKLNYKFVLNTRLNFMYGEKPLLREIIYNLLQNSINHHHTPENGTTLISLSKTEQSYILTIKDDGPGISLENQKKIFDIFHQLNEKSKNGHGLGLALVKKMVSEMKGTIRVESDGRSGTKFIVKWPRENKSITE